MYERLSRTAFDCNLSIRADYNRRVSETWRAGFDIALSGLCPGLLIIDSLVSPRDRRIECLAGRLFQPNDRAIVRVHREYAAGGPKYIICGPTALRHRHERPRRIGNEITGAESPAAERRLPTGVAKRPVMTDADIALCVHARRSNFHASRSRPKLHVVEFLASPRGGRDISSLGDRRNKSWHVMRRAGLRSLHNHAEIRDLIRRH